MEQVTPSGFKPNFKFERCKGCNNVSKYYLNEFNECDSCEKCQICNSQRKDYLNGFQICNSCCKQIEQVAPSGFKPNFKLESCKGKCYQRNYYLNEFNECDCEKCKRCNNQTKDYSNESQFRNSWYKQMERMTPSVLKPNFKLKKCNECGFSEYY